MKKKLNFKKIIFLTLIAILIGIFVFSSYKVIRWYMDSEKTKDIIDDFDTSKIIEDVSSADAVSVSPPENKENDYWDFIKTPFISVDFTTLKEKNPDTVAWLFINNTNINYPVVQTDNNDYYLTHAFNKSWSGAGWIYMDYRNNSVNLGKNTILYGHSMVDKTMFGSLLNARHEWWYGNKDNQVIKMSTPTHNILWQIFSIYKIPPESYYITTDFSSDTDALNFFNTLKGRSYYNFNTEMTKDDRILTLSTCNTSDGSERLVVHAKMISYTNR